MTIGTIDVHHPKIFDTKLLVLIGAGASKPLGMPLMRDFQNLVRGRIYEAQRELIELLNDLLTVHHKGTEEVTPDLEALLALIERYSVFYDILFTDDKFGYASVADDEWKKWAKMEVEGLLVPDVGFGTRPHQPDYLAQAYFRKRNLQSLNTLLRNLMFEVYGKNLDSGKLNELYSPLFTVLGRHFPQDLIPVFTTNYDVAIETYAAQAKIELETGFESAHTGNFWKPARFEQFQPVAGGQNMALFKLHGSLAWHRKDNTIISTGLPVRDPTGYKSVVIYPTQTKEFPDEEPFRTMYSFLKGCLRVAELAIVIGYSFRDRGIRRIMNDASDINRSLVFILLCGPKGDKFAQQNLSKYKTIPDYFDTASSGSKYLEKLDAALAELKS